MSVHKNTSNWKAELENDLIKLIPLQESDFEALYAVAADPLIWEQHPNWNRYQREEFETFFRAAIACGTAYLILDQASGEVIGSSRFYNFDAQKKHVFIGYTFIDRKFWGKGYNPSLKKLMIDYAFGITDHVCFQVGASNIRSQKAISHLNAVKTGEEMAYSGETPIKKFTYQISKADWQE